MDYYETQRIKHVQDAELWFKFVWYSVKYGLPVLGLLWILGVI